MSSTRRSSTSAPAPNAVDRLIGVIDGLSTATGWFAGWLIVPLALAVAWEVTARYAFNAPTRWVNHVTYLLYGTQFMLAAAYTLQKGGHIRTDVFYSRWSARTRATIDAVSYVTLFFPGLLFVLYAGTVEAWQAWQIGERAGRFLLYPFKAVIPLTAALLLLQGFAELVRCVRVIGRGGR